MEGNDHTFLPENDSKEQYQEFDYESDLGLPSMEEIKAESNLRMQEARAKFAQELEKIERSYRESNRQSDLDITSHASASTNGDTSSLGILSMGNLTDFSEYDLDSPVDILRKEKSSNATKTLAGEFEDNHNPKDSYKKKEPFNSSDAENPLCNPFEFCVDKRSFEERLYNLFGEDSHNVKNILEGTITLEDVENDSIISKNPPEISKPFVLEEDENDDCRYKKSNQPKSAVKMQRQENRSSFPQPSHTLPETPLTKLLKKNHYVAPEESSICSIENPFSDKSCFDVEKLYGIDSMGSVNNESSNNTLCESEVDFNHDQISARSSSITRAADATYNASASSLMKEFDKTGSAAEKKKSKNDSFFPDLDLVESDLAYRKSFKKLATSEEAKLNCEKFSDDEFMSHECVLKMLEEVEESFRKEHKFEIGIQDIKENEPFDFSLSEQPGAVDPPSWWSKDDSPVSQLSVGQLIGARTECLGALGDNSSAQRPSFGIDIHTPQRGKSDVQTFTKNRDDTYTLSETEAKESSPNTDSCSSILGFETISQYIREISLNDDFTSIGTKLLQKKVRKKNKGHPKEERCSTLKKRSNVYESSSDDADGDIESTQETRSSTFVEKADVTLKAEKPLVKDNVQEAEDVLSLQLEVCDTQKNLKADRLRHGPQPKKAVYRSTSASDISKKGDKAQNGGLLNIPGTDNVLSISSVHAQSDSESSGSSKTFISSLCSNHVSQCCQHELCVPCQKGCSVSQGTCSRSSTINFTGNPVCHASSWLEHQNAVAACKQHPGMNQPVQSSFPSDILSRGVNYNLMSTCLPQVARSLQSPYIMPEPLPGMTCCVQGPDEFRYPYTYVGNTQKAVLTLHNPTGIPLYYHLKLASAVCNNLPVSVDLLGLTFGAMVHSNGAGPVDIKISYTPTNEGETTVDLHIAPSRLADTNVLYLAGSPKVIKIFLRSERPHISLTSKSKTGVNSLRFGLVVEKSSVSDVMILENLGESPIALRINIEKNTDSSHTFDFVGNASNSSEALKCSFPSTNTILCMLAGRSELEQRKLHIPVVFKAGKCRDVSKTEEVNGRITVTYEASSNPIQLSTCEVSAVVGAICLKLKEHIPKNVLVMKAVQYNKASHNLKLVNEGSIPASVDLAINPDGDSLSVMPQTMHLKPSSEDVVTVFYHPSSTDVTKGTLQAAVHSQDLVFDIVKVQGHVTQSSNFRNSRHSNARASSKKDACLPSINIDCNKKYLAFGGVNINEVVVKSLTIHNPSAEVFQAKATIANICNEFAMIGEDNDNLTSAMELTLSPNGCKKIKVVFRPSEKQWYSNHLNLRPLLFQEKVHFTIPLTGYGGVSSVRVVEQDSHYKLCLNSVNESGGWFSTITLHNAGCREAFVKLFHCSGNNGTHDVNLDISPSEFILFEGQNKVIHVSCVPDVESSTPKSEEILIYWGEEIMRQRMRRCGAASIIPSLTGPLRCINFDVPYLEENVPNDGNSSPKGSAVDVSMFYHCLHKMSLNVIIPPENASLCQTSSFAALTLLQDSTPQRSHVADNLMASGCSPPVRDSVGSVRKASEVSDAYTFQEAKCQPAEKSVKDWLNAELSEISFRTDDNVFTVVPQSLKLDSENRDARVSITNNTNKEIKFKLTWSVNIISASPVQGLIPAKSEIGIRVKAITHFNGKQNQECSECFIVVACCGIEKRVAVQVVNLQKVRNPGKGVKTCVSMENLVNAHKQNPSSKREAVVKNGFTSGSSCSSSVICNRAHGKNASVDVLLESEAQKSDAPVVNQNEVADIKSERCSIASLCSNNLLEKKNSKASKKSRRCSSNVPQKLIVEPQKIEFPVSKPREHKTSHVLVKNWRDESCNISVVKPDAPFVVKTSSFTVKPNKYMKLPVHFCPEAPASYCSILYLKLENGRETNVPLIGKCVL